MEEPEEPYTYSLGITEYGSHVIAEFTNLFQEGNIEEFLQDVKGLKPQPNENFKVKIHLNFRYDVNENGVHLIPKLIEKLKWEKLILSIRILTAPTNASLDDFEYLVRQLLVKNNNTYLVGYPPTLLIKLYNNLEPQHAPWAVHFEHPMKTFMQEAGKLYDPSSNTKWLTTPEMDKVCSEELMNHLTRVRNLVRNGTPVDKNDKVFRERGATQLKYDEVHPLQLEKDEFEIKFNNDITFKYTTVPQTYSVPQALKLFKDIDRSDILACNATFTLGPDCVFPDPLISAKEQQLSENALLPGGLKITLSDKNMWVYFRSIKEEVPPDYDRTGAFSDSDDEEYIGSDSDSDGTPDFQGGCICAHCNKVIY